LWSLKEVDGLLKIKLMHFDQLLVLLLSIKRTYL